MRPARFERKRYVGLAIQRMDCDSRRPQGVFTAAYALCDDDGLEAHYREQLTELLGWFVRHLRVPRDVPPAAIFWFRSDANGSIEKVWELVHVLRACDLHVTITQTDSPGRIEYEDEQQVAAIPERR